jgi:hypothetical protein
LAIGNDNSPLSSKTHFEEVRKRTWEATTQVQIHQLTLPAQERVKKLLDTMAENQAAKAKAVHMLIDPRGREPRETLPVSIRMTSGTQQVDQKCHRPEDIADCRLPILRDGLQS